MIENKNNTTCLNDICNTITNLKKESLIIERNDYNIDVAYEDDNYLYIFDVVAVVGEAQNKNNRVYDWNTIKTGAEFYKEVIKKYDYFRFMLDGHSDNDGYSSIAGIVLNQTIDDNNKIILIDIAIPKGTSTENIIRKSGIVGISMRMLAEETKTITKMELDSIYNNKIRYINDEIETFVDNNNIEYVYGGGKIIRYDIVNLPSFNQTFKKITKILPLKELKDERKLMLLKYLPLNNTIKSESTRLIKKENLLQYSSKEEMNIVEIINTFNKNYIKILKAYKPTIGNITYVEFKNLLEKNTNIIDTLYKKDDFIYVIQNINKDYLTLLNTSSVNIDKFIDELITTIKNSVGLLQKLTVNALFDYVILNTIMYIVSDKRQFTIELKSSVDTYNDDFSEIRFKYLLQQYSNDIYEIIKNDDSKDLSILLTKITDLIIKHQKKYSYILTDYGCVVEVLRFIYKCIFDIDKKDIDRKPVSTVMSIVEKWF